MYVNEGFFPIMVVEAVKLCRHFLSWLLSWWVVTDGPT